LMTDQMQWGIKKQKQRDEDSALNGRDVLSIKNESESTGKQNWGEGGA